MEEAEKAIMAKIGPRGISAMRRTRPWALLISIIVLIGVAINLVDLFVRVLAPMPIVAPDVPQKMVSVIITTSIVFGIAGIVVGSLGAWFALQYGRRIKVCLDTMSSQTLEDALRAQRHFWTFQGVMMIVGIVVAISAFVGMVVMGVVMMQHGGYSP